MKRHVYTFSSPRTEDGGADFKQLVRNFMDADLDPAAWLPIADMCNKFVAVGAQPTAGLTELTMAQLALGAMLTLRLEGEAIGNPRLAADGMDVYLDNQWNSPGLYTVPEGVTAEAFAESIANLLPRMDKFVELCGGTFTVVNTSQEAVA
jgi:hypothetical protein